MVAARRAERVASERIAESNRTAGVLRCGADCSEHGAGCSSYEAASPALLLLQLRQLASLRVPVLWASRLLIPSACTGEGPPGVFADGSVALPRLRRLEWCADAVGAPDEDQFLHWCQFYAGMLDSVMHVVVAAPLLEELYTHRTWMLQSAVAPQSAGALPGPTRLTTVHFSTSCVDGEWLASFFAHTPLLREFAYHHVILETIITLHPDPNEDPMLMFSPDMMGKALDLVRDTLEILTIRCCKDVCLPESIGSLVRFEALQRFSIPFDMLELGEYSMDELAETRRIAGH